MIRTDIAASKETRNEADTEKDIHETAVETEQTRAGSYLSDGKETLLCGVWFSLIPHGFYFSLLLSEFAFVSGAVSVCRFGDKGKKKHRNQQRQGLIVPLNLLF